MKYTWQILFLAMTFITSSVLAITNVDSEQDMKPTLVPVIDLLLSEENSVACIDNDNDNYFANEGCGSAIDCNDNDLNINPGVVDLPDYNSLDLNCDGIDGELDKAVFVSTSGSDLNSGLDINFPLKSIGEGIEKLINNSEREYILVSDGSYFEGSLTLISDISIYGGYKASSSWTRTNDYPIISAGIKGMIAEGINNVTLDYLMILSAENGFESGSSYGIFLSESTNINITRSIIYTGNASNGTAGTDGIKGSNGINGGIGNAGCEDSSVFCSACTRPVGGTGGENLCGYGDGGNGGEPGKGGGNGDAGSSGTGPNPGTGGLGGTIQDTCGQDAATCSCISATSIVSGQNGGSGLSGNNGLAGNSFGTMTASGYLPSNGNNGSNGNYGSGGGGGGGGKGGDNECDSYGSSGGGGGSGGCGGEGGNYGTGGGSSVGIWLYNCDAITIDNNDISTGNGGNGGPGGLSGIGGTGGAGGAGGFYGGSGEQDDGGCGGYGGNGGDGGDGGHGGGGGGGPSIGIVMNGGNVSMTNNSFSLGLAGDGGSSSGNIGADGMRSIIYNSNE